MQQQQATTDRRVVSAGQLDLCYALEKIQIK